MTSSMYLHTAWIVQRLLLVVMLGALLPTHSMVFGEAGNPQVDPLEIKKVYDRKNQITDQDRWLKTHFKASPKRDLSESLTLFSFLHKAESVSLFSFLHKEQEQFSLAYTICEGVGQPVIAFYGIRPRGYQWTPATMIIVYGYDGTPIVTLNLEEALQSMTNEKEFASPNIRHALVRDKYIYISLSHRTYAKATKGINAQIKAYDLDGQLQWTSKPLVANSDNFLIIGDVILTGYGFTKEPDYFFQLNRHTGVILKRHKLRSGPDWFSLEAPRLLHIRTYNRNVGYQLTRNLD